MLKKILCVIILFLSFSSFGQEINELRNKASNSSDSELIVFIQKAKDQGLSLLDAEKQLVLIGGKAEEVKKLRNLWNKKIPQESQFKEKNENIVQSNFGNNESFVKDSLKQDVEGELKRFGSDFLKIKIL